MFYSQAAQSDSLLKILASAIAAAAIAFFFRIVNSVLDRRRERRNITRALLTEIRRINDVITSHEQWWKNRGSQAPLPPLVPIATNTYNNLAKQIALVDERAAPAIVEFYGYVYFINELQKKKRDYEKKNVPHEFYALYAEALHRHLQRYGNHLFQRHYRRYGLA